MEMYRWTGKFRKKWKRLTFIQVSSMGKRLCWLLQVWHLLHPYFRLKKCQVIISPRWLAQDSLSHLIFTETPGLLDSNASALYSLTWAHIQIPRVGRLGEGGGFHQGSRTRWAPHPVPQLTHPAHRAAFLLCGIEESPSGGGGVGGGA